MTEARGSWFNKGCDSDSSLLFFFLLLVVLFCGCDGWGRC